MLSNGAGNRTNEEDRNENIANQVEYSVRTRNGANQTDIDKIKKVTIEETIKDSIEILTENINKEIVEIKPIRNTELKKKEPTSPRSYMLVILEEICEEIFKTGTSCTPEDFTNINKHKIPKKIIKPMSKKEAKVPAIVSYAMGIVLMTSLGAALLELYKAKRHPEKKDGKNSLSRKCSLADLTVMKHQRKEMVRRESLMEVPEESVYSKQLDRRSLHRQCSFPVAPSTPPKGTPVLRRRLSMQANRFIAVVDGRPAAVLEGGRRHSIVSDGRQPLILESSGSLVDGRAAIFDRVALEDSPERRFHGRGRRVHRH